jgi:hypothetical protein
MKAAAATNQARCISSRFDQEAVARWVVALVFESASIAISVCGPAGRGFQRNGFARVAQTYRGVAPDVVMWVTAGR